MILVAVVALVLTGCGGDDNADADAETVTTTSAASSTTGSSTGTSPTTSTTTATVAPATVPPPPAPYQPVAGYAGTVAPIDAARVTASWRAGCPVGPEHLRLLTLPFIGFDGDEHTGEMVVHRDVADRIVGVFRTLYDARFPIERMELVDVYGADDDRSTMANNTSAFNCRPVTGGGGWSQHSYGRAIDINPVQNPYVYRDGHVLDPNAAPFTDRDRTDPGMIKAGDVVVSAFSGIGWGWGGNFNSIKDYQHFSATGG